MLIVPLPPIELSNVTFSGPVAVMPMAPQPCPSGSQWGWAKWYDIWYNGVHYLGNFCSDPINPVGMVVVTPNFPVGSNPDMSIQSMTVTASGMAEFDLSEPSLAFRGAAITGRGDVRLREACDDGSQCSDPSRRRVSAAA